ncbi:hypothetical protein WN944_024872 [Citrus x changshan-huyou]|uniref:Uncharacterized protein n=1 Tax=Citrus x changshan-huyou TaxID=2935761 RepID=A0AAP0LNQ6_9ROSI
MFEQLEQCFDSIVDNSSNGKSAIPFSYYKNKNGVAVVFIALYYNNQRRFRMFQTVPFFLECNSLRNRPIQSEDVQVCQRQQHKAPSR